ncbi:hypothetical protein [Planctomycetes bacterium Pla163]|uniref:hypothetical protein n=1 Tax=Rohdeia mirabilis TaxID=2528008 RepID=UPI0011A4F25A
MKTTIALAVCLLFSSCFLSRGHQNLPLAAEAYASLRPGESTAIDATEVLGAPSEVVELGNGSAWRYEYAQVKRTGLFLLVFGFLNEDTQSDRIWLFFDADGTLVNAAATFEAERAEWESPWSGDE